VLAIEAGLVLIRGEERTLFVGTAGGVLRCDGHWLTILTPLAVRGMEADSVVALLDQALAAAHEEAEIREALGKLEHRILHELRREPARLARGPKK
jgi:F0F1-type ATP synthase epsilon subunit